MDISYDFYIRHNMHAVEWKLFAMVNKNKSLIKKLNLNLQLENLKAIGFGYYKLIVLLYI